VPPTACTAAASNARTAGRFVTVACPDTTPHATVFPRSSPGMEPCRGIGVL
jgi:ribosomal protein S27E